METSRKRFNSESDIGSNKRKARKSKRLLAVDVDVDLNMGQENENQLNHSPIISSSQLVKTVNTTDAYSEEDDIIIINYFRKNMHMLKLKDDLSTYSVLKVKHSFQRSAKSLQTRFLNHILPNLFKYNVINDSDLIDFYDVAKFNVPDEFINSFIAAGTPNKAISVQNNETNASVDKCNKQSVVTSNVENSQTNVTSTNMSTNHEITANNLNEITMTPVPSTSRTQQNNNQIEALPSTSEEKCLKSILNYIQFNNSNGTSVFIPHTELNIPSVANRLLNEFGIRKESIEIIPKERFDTIVQLKDTFDLYDELVYKVLKNSSYGKSIEQMIPDARKLFEYISPFMDKSKRLLQRISPEISSNIGTKIILNDNQISSSVPVRHNEFSDKNSLFNSTFNEIEISNVGQIISTLSDSFDQVTISSNRENQESSTKETYSIDIKTEPVAADEEVLSPYFLDHTYCKNANSPLNTKTNATLPNNNIENCAMDFESNLIDRACTPQILFSKRSKDKILNENLNVDHLIPIAPNNCDENNFNDNETSLVSTSNQE